MATWALASYALRLRHPIGIHRSRSVVEKAVINALFEFGLGELLVLHVHKRGPILGNVVKDKGKLILKDRKVLAGVSSAQLGPCYDLGVVGALSYQPGREWGGLTFSGPDLCDLHQDLSSTRVDLLTAACNEFNERLIDFDGSMYRGFQLLLETQILPVVLMQQVEIKTGEFGLAVSNLKFGGVPMQTLAAVHDTLSTVVMPQDTLEVESMRIDPEDFSALFAQFRGHN